MAEQVLQASWSLTPAKNEQEKQKRSGETSESQKLSLLYCIQDAT